MFRDQYGGTVHSHLEMAVQILFFGFNVAKAMIMPMQAALELTSKLYEAQSITNDCIIFPLVKWLLSGMHSHLFCTCMNNQ